MSYDVARGGNSSQTSNAETTGKGGKKRQRQPTSTLLTTTAPQERLDLYTSRNHSVRDFSGSMYKDKKTREVSTNKPVQNSRDKKAEARLELEEKRRIDNAIRAAEAEILNTTSAGFIEVENEMERTYKLKQHQLKKELDEQSAKQIFDLSLPNFSPYKGIYSNTGRYLLLAGRGGHLAMMDALTLSLKMELHLNASTTSKKTTVQDACFLHNETMFATAETNSVFVYDEKGTEIHNLTEHVNPLALTFLPYHWLLASVGNAGYLKYTDTSTGQLISEHRTKLGPCSTLTSNPYNAVLHLGHGNGCVTLWSPNMSQNLVKMLCHRGGVTGCKVDLGGNYMVTSGVDSQVKVWDVRTFKLMHSYYSHNAVDDIDISQRGVIAVAGRGSVTLWKDAIKTKTTSPYMSHTVSQASINSVRFRPYEDVCGIGHSAGFSSIVIPGSGEPNFDSMENNIFEDKKQRQEKEVRSLLDKLSPDMIALDPNVVGSVERDRASLMKEQRSAADEADRNKLAKPEKRKARGRGKISKKLAKKHKNIVDAGVVKLRELKEEAKKANGSSNGDGNTFEERKKIKGLREGGALSRFF